MNTTARILQVSTGFAISAIALYLALRGVQWDEVRRSAGDASVPLLVAATGAVLATMVVRAVRWRVVLSSGDSLRLWHLYASLNAGYFVNNIVPLQIGELARAYMLSELSGVSTTRTLSTVFIERIIDILVLLLILLLLAPFVPVPGWLQLPALLLAGVIVVIASMVMMAARSRGPVPAIIRRGLALAPEASRPKLSQMADNAIRGFGALASPRVGVRAAVLTAAGWFGMAVGIYLGILAFDLGLGFEAALLLVVCTTFGFFFPSPGGIGVYHAITVAVLTGIFSIERNTAVSFALVVHLVFYLPAIVVGALVLWIERKIWQETSLFEKLSQLRGTSQLAGALDKG